MDGMLNVKLEEIVGGGTVEVPMVWTEVSLQDDRTVFLTGQALTCSPNNNGSLIYSPNSASWTTCATPDIDELFKLAMQEHEERVHSDDRDNIYFAKDGTLTLMCHISSGNEIRMMVMGDGDVNKASDIAIGLLEEMKNRIDEIQKKVFELSLKQK